jgi:hypothetical protein
VSPLAEALVDGGPTFRTKWELLLDDIEERAGVLWLKVPRALGTATFRRTLRRITVILGVRRKLAFLPLLLL